MAIDPIALSVSTMAISTTLGAFYQFMPPLSEVRKRNVGDSAFAADVRTGEIMATALAVGVGGIASYLSGSPVPAILGVVLAFALVGGYETTLRSYRPMEA
jgi:hypothetical protein